MQYRERTILIGSYAVDRNLIVLIFKFRYVFDWQRKLQSIEVQSFLVPSVILYTMCVLIDRIQTAKNRPDEAFLFLVISDIYDSTVIFDPCRGRYVTAGLTQRAKFHETDAKLIDVF